MMISNTHKTEKFKSISKSLVKWNDSFFFNRREESVVKSSGSQTQTRTSLALWVGFVADVQPTCPRSAYVGQGQGQGLRNPPS